MTAAATDRPVLALAEYQRTRTPAPPPTPEDLRLADRLSGDAANPRLAVRWLAGGDVEITASSWVGVVRFSHLDVHVVPKLVGGPLRVLRMLDYAAGVSMLRRLPTSQKLLADGSDLFDLICLLLVEETDALLRDGLLRDYRSTDDTLTVLRGRLRHRDQFLRRYGRLDRLECHFDEYDSDTPANQLLATGVSLARRRASDATIRFALGRLTGILHHACQPTTGDADWYERHITYDRRTARYRPAHELAKLVLRHLAFDDLYASGGTTVSSFLLDMNAVFERFVTRLVHDALAATTLGTTTQHGVRAVILNQLTDQTYSTIRPDLTITEIASNRSVPVDVKYKTYDEKKVSSSDVYQTFLYAYALGDGPDERRAGILYPASGQTAGTRLAIRPVSGPTAARIAAVGIDVPAALDALAEGRHNELFDSIRTTILAMTGLAATV